MTCSKEYLQEIGSQIRELELLCDKYHRQMTEMQELKLEARKKISLLSLSKTLGKPCYEGMRIKYPVRGSLKEGILDSGDGWLLGIRLITKHGEVSKTTNVIYKPESIVIIGSEACQTTK